jgi:hypothetical protein
MGFNKAKLTSVANCQAIIFSVVWMWPQRFLARYVYASECLQSSGDSVLRNSCFYNFQTHTIVWGGALQLALLLRTHAAAAAVMHRQ